MKVVIMPGQILCGVCGFAMPMGSIPQPPSFLCTISCQNLKCADFNKTSLFPLVGLELKDIDGPQIVLPS